MIDLKSISTKALEAELTRRREPQRPDGYYWVRVKPLRRREVLEPTVALLHKGRFAFCGEDETCPEDVKVEVLSEMLTPP